MAFKMYNKDAVKLNTDELIREAYADYCAYLARGKDKRGYVFRKNGEPLCTSVTLEKIIDQKQSVLSTIHYDAAMSDGYEKWYSVCEDSAIGKNQKANTASLQMIMRNKFGWDAKDKEDEIADKKTHLTDFANALTPLSAPATQAANHTDSLDSKV